MARPIDTIQQLMLADIAADPVLTPADMSQPGLRSTSKRAFYRLLTRVFATCAFLLESLMDIYKASVENTASTAAAASAAWLQNQVFKFQYDASAPQIVQLINFAPAYPVVDASKQIISRCSVVTTVAGQTLIKVATGSTPSALSAPQLSALQNYVNTIGATISYVVTSTNADELYIQADVYYQGQYSAIISTNVIAAINIFLAALPFNGSLKVSDIESAIKSVQGVNDVILKNVIARKDSTSFTSGTFLVQNQQWISRIWATVSGYIISETTTGKTLTDSLNFIPQ
jgi:hypothetical protein